MSVNRQVDFNSDRKSPTPRCLCIRLAFLASALLWYANLSRIPDPFEGCAE